METIVLASILVLTILFVIVLVMCIVNGNRIRELNEYAEDGDLGETLKTYYKKVSDLRRTIHNASDKALEKRISACENKLASAYTKMHIVHFDAFDGISGKQSFSLALLDLTNSGFILTSLYGHSSCNTYIRIINEGNSQIKLIDEEIKALDGAIKNIRGGDMNG